MEEKYTTFMHHLKEARAIAATVDRRWEEQLTDIIEESQRCYRARELEMQWEPQFLEICPRSDSHPDLSLVFGFNSDDSMNPDVIIAESLSNGFSLQREFDPEVTDIEKLVTVFAKEVAAELAAC